MNYQAWLFPVSLGFVVLGIIVSVLEEWKKSGLTDTSFTTLGCWILGLSGIGYWGVKEQEQIAAWVTVVPIVLFSYWVVLKLKDWRTHQ